MINKNFDDLAKIAIAIIDVAQKFKEEAIKFDLTDLVVNLKVSETELSIIDSDLYNLTKKYGGKEYTPAKTVEANIGGVQFHITADNAEED